ncbi:MAG: hypothetical protein ACM31G_09720 [Flavobacteriales bacterium]
MPKVLTINGANNPDELQRLAALEQLNELDTIVLTRLAELSKKSAAVKYFKNGLLFETVKGFLR